MQMRFFYLNRCVLKAAEISERCSVHHTITSHLWVDFMNGNLLQKVRKDNLILHYYTDCILERKCDFYPLEAIGL